MTDNGTKFICLQKNKDICLFINAWSSFDKMYLLDHYAVGWVLYRQSAGI
jgi:hypothetical protein